MAKKTEKCIRILIAEDYEIVHCGLKSILDQQADFEVIGEASSCKETLTLTSTLKPDVILMDLVLDDDDSLDNISKLKNLCSHSKILVFTTSSEKDIHLLSLRHGAVGILFISQTAELLCKAIRSVHLSDELWIDKTLVSEIWKQNTQFANLLETKASQPFVNIINKSDSPPVPLGTLTPRENQIACLSSKGLNAKQIGAKLFISEKTVRNQLTQIYSKLNVKNQLELSINSVMMNVCDN